MKKTFELLKKKGLRTPESIERDIMNRYTVSEILELNQELIETIDVTEPLRRDLSVFDFVADSDMTAQHTTCPVWSCRLARIADTARFAALYCDTLYILNYFEDYPSPDSAINLEPSAEIDLRYRYAGDLKILFLLKPLFEEGIVKLMNMRFHLCKSCAQELGVAALRHRLDGIVADLSQEYLKFCGACLVRNKKLAPPYNLIFRIRGPGDLMHETGGVVWVPPKVDMWLLRKSGFLNIGSRKRVYHLTAQEMRKVGIPRNRLEFIASDIFYQHVASLLMETKYLTHRKVDVRFLSSMTTDPLFRKYNDILSSEFLCRIPMFQNAPLKAIVLLRKKEHEAFLVFRNQIGKVITQYLKEKKPLAKSYARGIYEDMIYPDLCKLDAKAKVLRRGAILKSLRDVFITSGVLSFGLFSGLLPTNLQALFAAVGGFHLSRELVNSIASILQTPDEIRNHNFFFLWRLSHKVSRHSPRGS